MSVSKCSHPQLLVRSRPIVGSPPTCLRSMSRKEVLSRFLHPQIYHLQKRMQSRTTVDPKSRVYSMLDVEQPISVWRARQIFGNLEPKTIGDRLIRLVRGMTRKVPLIGRRQYIGRLGIKWLMRAFSKPQYDETIKRDGDDNLLLDDDPKTKRAQEIMDNLALTQLLNGRRFVVKVWNNPDEYEAHLSSPTDIVFITSGFIDSCETDDALAAILSHELVHGISCHGAEQVSISAWAAKLTVASLCTVAYIFPWSWFPVLAVPAVIVPATVLIEMRLSRIHEIEADCLSHIITSQGCYNPVAAREVHKSVLLEEEEYEKNVAPKKWIKFPAWLSSHPTAQERLDAIEDILPGAKKVYAASQCARCKFLEEHEGKKPRSVCWKRREESALHYNGVKD